MVYELKNGKNHSSRSRKFTSGDACDQYRFIQCLKPRAKQYSHWTSPLYHIFRWKQISLQEKWLPQPRKGIWVSWRHNVMREFFRLLWRNVNVDRKNRKCFKIVWKSNSGFWQKMLMQLQKALLRIIWSLHSLSATYLHLLHSGIYGWILQALWISFKFLQLSETLLPTETAQPDCLHLMNLLVLKQWNLFDENCDGVQYCSNCCH